MSDEIRCQLREIFAVLKDLGFEMWMSRCGLEVHVAQL
jgi:hypothetical protein